MRRRFPVGAGALGGLAAGLMLLGASTAQAREPAAIPGLKSIDPVEMSSGLRVMGEDGELKPLDAAPVVNLTSLPTSVVALAGSSIAWSRSSNDPLTCLAQAIYFEARSESEDGQEAVAQVVMNRTHSARYPGSVCGVVFQRSGGGTCQFTFACDGSMDRLIQPTAWDKAKSVASQALGGFVYKPLETATHYHASWMTPYWAPTLTRVQQIGGQIFYQ